MADASSRGADGDRELTRVQLDTVLGSTVPASSTLTPVDDLSISQCEALDKLFARSCAMGEHRLADPDGILIDVMQD